MTTELRLEGQSRLAGCLSRAARRFGHDLTYETPPIERTVPRLALLREGAVVSAIGVEPDGGLAIAIAEDALNQLMDSWRGAQPCSAVVLAPAGGLPGPADKGPVDAVVTGRPWVVAGSRASCTVRLLTVQQTRCWLMSFSCKAGNAGGPGPDIEQIPSWIAGDTARVCEYAQDRGLGDDWPGLFLLGAPLHGPDGSAEALIAFTEANYAHRLVGVLLTEAGS